MPKTDTFRIWDEEIGAHMQKEAEIPSAEQDAEGKWLISGSGWTLEFKGEIDPELAKLVCEQAAKSLGGVAMRILTDEESKHFRAEKARLHEAAAA